ncbi:MAG: hypothetical protein WD646_09020 [Actinomycetota bacterium]
MLANPEPDDRVTIARGECSIAQSYARRPHALNTLHGREPDTGMAGVGHEAAIRLTSAGLNVRWKRDE